MRRAGERCRAGIYMFGKKHCRLDAIRSVNDLRLERVRTMTSRDAPASRERLFGSGEITTHRNEWKTHSKVFRVQRVRYHSVKGMKADQTLLPPLTRVIGVFV